MDFIDFQALVENGISEEKDIAEVSNAIDEEFIDNQQQQPVSLRSFYMKFENVICDI